MMRLGAALGLVGVLGAAVRWGEDDRFPFGTSAGEPLLIAAFAVAVVVAACWRRGRFPRVFVAIAAIVAGVVCAALGAHVGAGAHQRAYNECVVDGGRIHAHLRTYREVHGSYPASLAELPENLPCRTHTRRTILRYARTPSGYEVSFRDWMMDCVGSEEGGFVCHK